MKYFLGRAALAVRRGAALGITSMMFNGAHAAVPACQPLKDTALGWSVSVRASGQYCMATDLKQTEASAISMLPHLASPTDPLLVIKASHVDIDLDRHSLLGKRPSVYGLWVSGGYQARHFPVRVHNGRIKTEMRPAVFMGYQWNTSNTRFSDRGVGAELSRADSIDDYVSTGFVLEDLTLEATEIAVILQGRNNVIRRCKIIGGNSTVNLYGPGLVFEDNEIMMTASEPKSKGEAPIALYLEDAEGAVVRNNRITLRGKVTGAEAIVLKNSANVVLQNNSVNGGIQTYKLLDPQSSLHGGDF
jgi:hypothetical protein